MKFDLENIFRTQLGTTKYSSTQNTYEDDSYNDFNILVTINAV